MKGVELDEQMGKIDNTREKKNQGKAPKERTALQ